ncbi:glycoside hydrolase family 43 protein [Phytohabitans rumicis]|uniref:Alpha-N-arabinofuranosidase n=1 Tax=Phytohabitans rumicis TaxID=1076125 RepID=A0A6V8L1R7_9ACTN|nr:glycoside hydrolase family 43 protein [Phytohabitans rumicis]GFJ88868.1 alpha-N-arabinofuranosidase [Phytohabitans rumicis]
MISNPVLPGFYPDPSILRVGVDYYLASSTFEWFPGVPIHHSTDLANWRLIGHALTDPSEVDLRGVPDSAGVWAPSLSHHDGLFWLIYSVVHTRTPAFKDVDNYLITAPDITGPWSKPVFLNATGFDPSLFHDEDGRRWLVQMRWDHRPAHPSFAGIILQEYDHDKRALVGPVRTILRQETLIEGPNLYRRDGWYYLMLAEGGTGWNHGVLMTRSRSIEGPYEVDPRGSLLTTRDDESVPLQKAGHGELVESPEGEWFLAHLASRPVVTPAGRYCVLGRETCIQRVEWASDGWLRLAGGGNRPALAVPGPVGAGAMAGAAEPERDDFDGPALDPAWVAPRGPIDESWASLTEHPGWLRLRGRQSPHSLFAHSLVARRLRALPMQATTCLRFAPTDGTQAAGLILWYDASTHFYLRVTRDERLGPVVGVALTDDGRYAEPVGAQLGVADWDVIHLRARIEPTEVRFAASPDGVTWHEVGPPLETVKLSDDYGSGLRFTGTLVGLCAHDLTGTRVAADFDYFSLAPSTS